MKLGTAIRPHVKSLSAESDEDDLAVRFAQGEPLAFEIVVERYSPRVTALAGRLLGWRAGAEDIAQEVFLAALVHQRRFRGDSSLWTWLAKLTINRCRSVQRRRWLFDKFLGVAALAHPQLRVENPPGIQLLADETAVQVRAAVGQLPLRQREVIVLHYLEGHSVEQIAHLLGERRNTVEVRLVRARKLLQSSLAELTL